MHINELTRRFGIELSIVSPSPIRRVPYRAPDGPNVIVEVTGATQMEVDAAKEGITAKAKAIAEKREKHKQKVSRVERVSLLGKFLEVPPTDQFFSRFHWVFRENWQNRCLASTLRRLTPPLPKVDPGSTIYWAITLYVRPSVFCNLQRPNKT